MNNEISGRKVVKNAGWIIFGKIFQMLLNLLVGLLTARYLGPDNYGLINYAAAYTTFFTALCTLGINSIIVKNLVDHPEEEGLTIGTTLLLRVVSSILSALMIVGFVCIMDAGERLTITVTALYSIALLFQVFDTINYWFQSKLKSKYAAIAALISYIAMSLYRIILLIRGLDVRWFSVANSVDYIVLAVVLFVAYKRCGGPKLSFSWKKGKQLLDSSKSFILCGLMVSIYNCTDRLMLKQMLSETAVGHYAAAVSICSMWAFVLAAIIDSLNPVIMQAHNTDSRLYIRLNKRLYSIVFYVSLAVSVVICAGAKLIITILYGEDYLPATVPLQIITWYTAFSYLGVARNAWVVCENKQRFLTPLYIGSALTNVVLNFIFIPLWGASGAAFASLITQIATIFLFPALIKNLRPNCRLMIDAIEPKFVFSELKKCISPTRHFL